MRIGIVTHWNSQDNYGQLLQCYALQTLLRSWGHDAYLIRYVPEPKPLTVWQKIIAHVVHPQYLLHHLPIDTKRKRFVQQELELRRINQLNNPKRGFEGFRQEHLKMTDCIYTSYMALCANPPEADLYIVGSDQVWRPPLNSEATPGWFLQFGDANNRRIAYAASMGEGVPKRDWPALKQKLSNLNAISVREESAAKLCRELGYEATVTLDPTMLLTADYYRCMAKRRTDEEQYAFLYLMNVRFAEEFHLQQIMEYIEERGLHVMSVTGSGYYQGRELIEGNRNLPATIPEWLGLIDGAKCVLTTSYHGTIFSILMHRPFLTIGLEGKYSGANSRMIELLASLGLSERLFDQTKSLREQMDKMIDWENVDRKMEVMRLSSFEFLKTILQ